MNRKKRWCRQFRLSGSGKETGREKKKTIAEQATRWFSKRRPVLVFLMTFGVLLGLFYAITTLLPSYEKRFLLPHVCLTARVSGAVLAFLGQDITVTGNTIFSPGFSINIVKGCDAIEPIALFICAVLAFPAPFLRKIPGIIVGAVLLAVLNVARIVSLFLIGVYFPRAFHVMHADMWHAMFVLLAVIFWILWLLWATQSQIQVKHT